MHSCITHTHTHPLWPTLQHLLHYITSLSYPVHCFSCALVVKLKQQSRADRSQLCGSSSTAHTQHTVHWLTAKTHHQSSHLHCTHTWGEWQLPHTHRQTPRSQAALWEPPQTAMPSPHAAGRLQTSLTSSNPRPRQQHRHRQRIDEQQHHC